VSRTSGDRCRRPAESRILWDARAFPRRIARLNDDRTHASTTR
jgi:hypothetical protein